MAVATDVLNRRSLIITPRAGDMAVSSWELAKRRRKALWVLVPAAAVAGFTSSLPTPGVEGAKQVAIVFADTRLMAAIYQAYFDEQIGRDRVWEMLQEMGVIVAVGGTMAYMGVKVSEVILAEALNFIPVAGWALSGTITSSVTLTVGSLWLWLCDKAFREGKTPVMIWKDAQTAAVLSGSTQATAALWLAGLPLRASEGHAGSPG